MPYQLRANSRPKERPYSYYLDLVHKYKYNSFRIAQSDAKKVANWLQYNKSNDVKTAINYYKALGTPILEVFSP